VTPRIAVVLGTRPEIIKLAPVVHALGPAAELVFTAQHYDPELSDVFFRSCGLPQPRVVLTGVGGLDRADQIGTMLSQLTDLFRADRPDAVVVQGDTNSANAGAQAGHYLGIPVVHVEAGLRSHDRGMPEEINRLVIGALADVHCCATPANAAAVLAAGAAPEQVHLTGNPIVEATRAAVPGPGQRAALLAGLDLPVGGFVLATVHRPENTDDPRRLHDLLQGLGQLAARTVLPLHPRSRAALTRYGIEPPHGVLLRPPVDHPTFLALATEAVLIVSDSGGVQEEVTVLGRPLVVVRTSTERPESVEAGFAVLTEPAGIPAAAAHLLRPGWPEQLLRVPSPYGDGLAGERIAALARLAAVGRQPTALAG